MINFVYVTSFVLVVKLAWIRDSSTNTVFYFILFYYITRIPRLTPLVELKEKVMFILFSYPFARISHETSLDSVFPSVTSQSGNTVMWCSLTHSTNLSIYAMYPNVLEIYFVPIRPLFPECCLSSCSLETITERLDGTEGDILKRFALAITSMIFKGH